MRYTQIPRPSTYTAELGAEICRRIEQGVSLRKLCADVDMPHRHTVAYWTRGERGASKEFVYRYARARESGYRGMAEDILAIADGSASLESGHEVQAARLRVDSRKWLLSKMLPSEFGDRLDLNQSGDVTLNVITGISASPGSSVEVSDDE